jgi:hypothetical protein
VEENCHPLAAEEFGGWSPAIGLDIGEEVDLLSCRLGFIKQGGTALERLAEGTGRRGGSNLAEAGLQAFSVGGEGGWQGEEGVGDEELKAGAVSALHALDKRPGVAKGDCQSALPVIVRSGRTHCG